ncbi:MAG: hypothetical protein OQL19_18475 [Gammaproteobacteria bacterium]|nr:hypothetical protein [Gammaproteobacteria bacterium]
MTQSQRTVIIYYDFAERCQDDYDIMTKAIKLCGCRKRPNIIKSQLEDFDSEKSYSEEYINLISRINDIIIDKAKWAVQKEKRVRPTLPWL